MRPSLRSFWFRLIFAGVIGCGMAATEASAQVGAAIPNLEVGVSPPWLSIHFPAFWDAMNGADGITLFAAASPNGPTLVRLPFPAPFRPPTDDTTTYGWDFYGIPPGSYAVIVVLGIVDAPTQPAAAWTQFVVPGACTAAPGMAFLDREVAGLAPDAVRLFMTSTGGCASSYVIEAGTSPGASNALSLETSLGVLTASAVPPGHYYVRVTARNQFGVGPQSQVYPVAVPPCPGVVDVAVLDFRATVVGHQVTLNWTPPVAQPGRPITYYEIGLEHLRAPGEVAAPRVLIPTPVASFTATVPSGSYRLRLHAGNSCDSWGSDTITVTVP